MSGSTWPRLPRLGLWTTAQNRMPARALVKAFRTLDDSVFDQVWMGEGGGRDPFLAASLALSASSLTAGVGVANVYARDAAAAVACERDLTDTYPGRLVVGYGVSHPRQVLGRGARYGPPLATMRSYLADLAVADERYAGPGTEIPPRLIAALGPRMLRLAAERTAGAHTYCVPVRHTAQARSVLGPDSWLVVEQAVVVAPEAKAIARDYVAGCLRLENYVRSLSRMGFDESDLGPVPSDRLVDALVAYTPAMIRDRVAEHLDAGADQVCVQVLDERAVTDPTAAWLRTADILADLAGPLRDLV